MISLSDLTAIVLCLLLFFITAPAAGVVGACISGVRVWLSERRRVGS